MQQWRPPRHVRALLLLAAGIALLLSAAAAGLKHRPAAASARHAVNAQTVTGTRPAITSPTGLVPERLLVPALGVDAPVTAVGLEADDSLAVPTDPKVIGWWAQGARPGAAKGTAILAGHVNSATLGPGALARLTELQPGDEIIVQGRDGELHLRVAELRQYPKSELPAAEAFSQEVGGRLALVSCTGKLDPRTGHYRDNVIAYAVPSGR